MVGWGWGGGGSGDTPKTFMAVLLGEGPGWGQPSGPPWPCKDLTPKRTTTVFLCYDQRHTNLCANMEICKGEKRRCLAGDTVALVEQLDIMENCLFFVF
jgi:hypothetical protein